MGEVTAQKAARRVLVVYYSFSNQTRNLLKSVIQGFEESGIEVVWEKIEPMDPLRFPIGTIPSTIKMMFLTFFRKRFPIQELSPTCFDSSDLIILAGPTWSYNPSGPVLSLFDRDGKQLFSGRQVMPFISCRGYWRAHLFGLRSLLKTCGAEIMAPIVFSHPTPEPWRTIGVFLKLAGKVPEAGTSWFRRFYPKYGHSRQQIEEALRIGRALAPKIIAGEQVRCDFCTRPVRISEDES